VENTQENGTQICLTAQERFSTSDSESFIGLALNLLFAQTDVIRVDLSDGCEGIGCIRKTASFTVQGDEEDLFETVFAYSHSHIQNTLINQLEVLAEGLAAEAPAQSSFFRQNADSWNRYLDLNRQLKENAKPAEPANRSFSAGANFEYFEQAETTTSTSNSIKVYTESNIFQRIGGKVNNIGAEATFNLSFNFSATKSTSAESTQSKAFGYTLSDDDEGDFFSVDILNDEVYGTPVFQVKAGTSSSPWEPWYDAKGKPSTQPRDGPVLNVSPPVQTVDSPDGVAHFTLALGNDSQSEETREYHLSAIQTSNPHGARLSVNGANLNQPLSFTIDPGQTQEVTLSVARGPNHFKYDNLALMLSPPNDSQLAETVNVFVAFEAPCSDITLFGIEPGWQYTIADAATPFELALKDFDLAKKRFSDSSTLG
jgi:hypothetical protein